jgi:type II secretory pathway pseudopilin PulG
VYYEKMREQQEQGQQHAIAELQEDSASDNARPPTHPTQHKSHLPPLPPGAQQHNVRFTNDTVYNGRTEDSLSQIRQGTPLPQPTGVRSPSADSDCSVTSPSTADNNSNALNSLIIDADSCATANLPPASTFSSSKQ